MKLNELRVALRQQYDEIATCRASGRYIATALLYKKVEYKINIGSLLFTNNIAVTVLIQNSEKLGHMQNKVWVTIPKKYYKVISEEILSTFCTIVDKLYINGMPEIIPGVSIKDACKET